MPYVILLINQNTLENLAHVSCALGLFKWLKWPPPLSNYEKFLTQKVSKMPYVILLIIQNAPEWKILLMLTMLQLYSND